MKPVFLLVASLLVIAAPPVLAQQRSPTDQQIDQARAAMFQAEANFFSLSAQRLQAQLAEAVAREAARDRWWGEWWRGTYPDKPAP